MTNQKPILGKQNLSRKRTRRKGENRRQEIKQQLQNHKVHWEEPIKQQENYLPFGIKSQPKAQNQHITQTAPQTLKPLHQHPIWHRPTIPTKQMAIKPTSNFPGFGRGGGIDVSQYNGLGMPPYRFIQDANGQWRGRGRNIDPSTRGIRTAGRGAIQQTTANPVIPFKQIPSILPETGNYSHLRTRSNYKHHRISLLHN